MAIIITINNTIKDIIKTIVRAYPKSGKIKCFSSLNALRVLPKS